jgi:uncharacterized protein
MKFILVVLAVVVLLWLLRGTFGRARPTGPRPGKATGPQSMLACAQCGVHLPANEALPGRGGVFCGDAHRAAFEKAHPE